MEMKSIRSRHSSAHRNNSMPGAALLPIYVSTIYNRYEQRASGLLPLMSHFRKLPS